MRVILSGSGPATGFPVPNCPCATCRNPQPPPTASPPTPSPPTPSSPAPSSPAPAPSFVRAPARLSLPGGHHLDAAAALHGPSGPVPLPPSTPVPLTSTDPITAPSTDPITAPITDPITAPITDPANDPATVESLPGGALVTTPSATVLWSPTSIVEPTQLVEALRGRSLTTAYLGPPSDATGAEVASSRQSLGRVIARLRAVGAVTDTTEIAIIGLGHDDEPTTLPLVLGAWGAHRPTDGSEPGPAIPRVAGRLVLLGGTGSGKSQLAEDLLCAEPEVVYLATGLAPSSGDQEWAQRIERHRTRRPASWTTEECLPAALPKRLAQEDRPVLLDSVGSWLTAALDEAGAWHDRPGWRAELALRTSELVEAWRGRRAPLVAVTEEVGWSVVAPTSAGRLFTTELGRLNQRLTAESEHLLVVVAGRVVNLLT